MDFLNRLPQSDFEINRELLAKAVDMSQGNSLAVSSFLTTALRTYINKTKLESMGFKETLFHLPRFDEVKRVYAKKIAHYERKQDENISLNDPYFCGVIYPYNLTEVYLTAKGNLILQKSVSKEIHYRNGTVISENATTSSAPSNSGSCENEALRIVEITIYNQPEEIRRELPDSVHSVVMTALNSRLGQRLADQLDHDFVAELEL